MLVDLIITNNCNLRCTYCFENTNSFKVKSLNEYDNSFNNNEEMSEEIALCSIDFAAKIAKEKNDNHLKINFFGGEPLLRFDFIKYVVNYCNNSYSDKELEFSLTTNSTLFNKEISEYFLINNFDIIFSIDGCNKSHDINRKLANGTGSFSQIENNIKNIKYFIKNSKRNSIIKFIISPNNVMYFYDGLEYISDFNTNISFEFNLETEWSQKDFNTFIEQFKKYLIKYDSFRKTGAMCCEIEQIINMINAETKIRLCYAGEKQLTFTNDGQVYPCGRFASIGKLKIGDIYNGLNENQQIFSQYSHQIHSCNSKCKLFNLCCNECFYLNYLYTNNILIPSKFNCQIQQTIIYLVLNQYNKSKV